MRSRLAVVCAAIALVIGACSDDEPAGPTNAELLADLEGRSLTPAEVATRMETANLLCGTSDGVLDRIWLELDDDKFAFQEFVFTHVCPDRLAVYEARPTTTTTRPTATTRRTTTTTSPLRPSTSRPSLED